METFFSKSYQSCFDAIFIFLKTIQESFIMFLQKENQQLIRFRLLRKIQNDTKYNLYRFVKKIG